jgi:hypothetical protein
MMPEPSLVYSIERATSSYFQGKDLEAETYDRVAQEKLAPPAQSMLERASLLKIRNAEHIFRLNY